MPSRSSKFPEGYKAYQGFISAINLTIWGKRIDISELASLCGLEVTNLRRILDLKYVAPGDILFEIASKLEKLNVRHDS